MSKKVKIVVDKQKRQYDNMIVKDSQSQIEGGDNVRNTAAGAGDKGTELRYMGREEEI
ncbi:MAG: hypothetical protein IKN14_08970 [Clostridiales bacterium]|nr:hypothetical protein [Clostridiales bacterium]